MQEFQDKRLEVYRQFVGKHYKNGTSSRVPLPLLSLAVSTILRKLVSTEPQALVTTRQSDQRASAYGFELAINRSLRDMDFGRAMRTWSFEAMMSPLGVLKVALDLSETVNYDGTPAWVGRPSASPVLFDDWVHDMSARSLAEAAFCGNRYSLVKEYAQTSGLFDPEVVERIHKTEKMDEHSSQNLSRDKGHFQDDYQDMIEVWDIWVPDQGKVYTLSTEFEDLPPLRVVDWNGPAGGPYHFLWFDEVPGNTMPLPPVSLWRDVHELANILFNKLARQATRQKNMVAVSDDAVKDGKLIVAGADGEAIVTSQAEKVRQVSYGGIDNQNFGFVLQLKQLHNYFSGNPEGLAGLGPQSPTLGQDELLSAAANERIAQMQEMVDKATAGSMRAIAQFMLTNPVEQVPITRQVGEMEIPDAWSPDQMEGSPDDYEIELVPHSLRRKPPEARLGQINQVMQMLIAYAPVAQAMGMVPNLEAWIKLVARYSNMPEINDLVIYTQGQSMIDMDQVPSPKTPDASGGAMRNRTTKTPQGMEQDTITKLMGSPEAA